MKRKNLLKVKMKMNLTVRKMKIEKMAEAIIGGVLVLSGGVDFLATTIPGAALIVDAFGVG